MPSRPLTPEKQLIVHLGAILSRNQFAKDTDRVIEELRDAVGDRTDLLAQEAGVWIGAREVSLGFDDVTTLWTALHDIEGVEPWIPVGRERVARSSYDSRSFHRE